MTPATPDGDPVIALFAAERDGLLEYRGYSSGGRYEVVIAGSPYVLPAADVVPTVQRLRRMAELTAEGIPVRLREVRGDESLDSYLVEVGGDTWHLNAGDVLDWLDGYAAGHRGGQQRHAGDDQLGAIRELLTEPKLGDQLRLVILGLMYSREPVMRMEDLAAAVDRSKTTVMNALGFGAYLSQDLADRMIEQFGMRWKVSADGVAPTGQVDADQKLPELPGITRLRAIMEAADEDLLLYVGESAPNQARWLRRYELSVGQTTYTVEGDSLMAWLDGLGAHADVEDDGP